MGIGWCARTGMGDSPTNGHRYRDSVHHSVIPPSCPSALGHPEPVILCRCSLDTSLPTGRPAPRWFGVRLGSCLPARQAVAAIAGLDQGGRKHFLPADGNVVTGETKTGGEGIRRHEVGEQIRCIDQLDGARDAPPGLIPALS